MAKKRSAKTKAREDKRTPTMKTPPKNQRKDNDKAMNALETGSRKSTRAGANHVKPDSQLRRRTERKVRSPQSRHEMRGG